MKKSIQFCCLSLVACFVFILTIGCSQQEASKEDPRLTPKITTINKQKMLVVEMKGDPSKIGDIAYGALFTVHGKMREKIKNMENPNLKARYVSPPGTPLNEQLSIYGLTIPENAETLPELKTDPAMNIRIEYWEPADVAEILHIGPYTEISTSINKLIGFINENEYTIAGPTEMEFIVYAGMTIPDKYETMIRFPVNKKS
jgi:hypothetical protein